MSNRFGLRTLPFRLLDAIRSVRPITLILSALGAATAVFLLLPGSASYALWNGAASANAGTVTAATVSVTEAIAGPFAPTFHNGVTVTTGSVVITNTSNVSAGFSSAAALAAGTSSPLAQAITVNVWPATVAAPCSPSTAVPAGAYTGTLAAWTAALAATGTLGAGASTTYCVRDSMDVTHASGIASGSAVNIVFGATVTAGTTWRASASVPLIQTFLDDIAPTAPSNLTASTSMTTPVALSWTAATDNVGVVSYDVYRSGTTAPIGSSTTTTFTDSTVVANTTYTYTIVARDAAGNGTAATSGTSLLVDRTPPTMQSLTVAPGTAATLRFSATDNVGVSSYTIQLDGKPVATVPGTATSYADTTPPGNHTYSVTATDAAGNVSLPSTVSVVGTYQTGTWYEIKSASTGLCVTAPSSIGSGSALTQATCSTTPGTDTQAWMFQTNAAGGVNVVSALPNPASKQFFWTAYFKTPSPQITTTVTAPWTVTSNADGSFGLCTTYDPGGSSNPKPVCLDTGTGSGLGSQLLTTTPGSPSLTPSQSFYLVPVTP